MSPRLRLPTALTFAGDFPAPLLPVALSDHTALYYSILRDPEAGLLCPSPGAPILSPYRFFLLTPNLDRFGKAEVRLKARTLVLPYTVDCSPPSQALVLPFLLHSSTREGSVILRIILSLRSNAHGPSRIDRGQASYLERGDTFFVLFLVRLRTV